MTSVPSLRPANRPFTAPRPGSKSEHIVVIGAGFGGMAAALRMRAKGYEVTIVDRCDRLGGRAQVYERDGFTYDAGPTVITAEFLFEELFALFGKQRSDYVEMLPVEPWYRFQFSDDRVFDYGGTVEDTLDEIGRFDPADREGYRNLLAASEKIYDRGFRDLADRPFHRFRTMLSVLPDLARLRCDRSVYGMVSHYLRDPALRRAFSIQPLLVGGNPFDTSAIYSLIHALERKWGVMFPKGGTGALVAALGRLMEDVGVTVRLGATVDEVVIRQRKAVGVRLEDGHLIPADRVICNGDPPFLYKNMMPKARRRRWTARRLDKLRYSMGLFVLYFGTRRTYADVQHHTILFGDRYQSLLRDIFDRKVLADDFSLYLHRPTATDPDMAPEGCDAFYVLSPVPNLQGDVDWATAGPQYRDRILDELEGRLLPGLRDNLVHDFYVTPEHFRDQYLTRHGTGFSVQPVLRQSAWFRFHNRSEEVENLYLVGAGTHPGAGLPGVLSSAKLVDRLIPASRTAGSAT